MSTVRRISPTDTLEAGFRAAHNQTVDAIADYSTLSCDQDGVLSFYNDLGELLGTLDLSPFFKLKNEGDSSNPEAQEFFSASEIQEGLTKYATADEALAGLENFKAITPATLAYVLEQLGSGSTPTLDQVLKAGNDSDEVLSVGNVVVPEQAEAPDVNALMGYVIANGDMVSRRMSAAKARELINITWDYLLSLNGGNVARTRDILVQSLSLSGSATPEVYEIDSPAGFTISPSGDPVLRRYSHDRDAQYKFVLATDPTVQLLVDRLRTKNVVAQDMGLTRIARAEGMIEGLYTGQVKRDGNNYQQVMAGPEQIHQLIRSLNAVQISEALAEYSPDVSPGGPGFPIQVLCRDAPTTTPTPSAGIKPKKITADMINVEQTHGLNLPRADLFWTLTNSQGYPDSTVEISFPTNNTYLLSLPPEQAAGYLGGGLKLEPYA